LSIDDRPDYEEKLQWTCANIHLGKDQLWEALMSFLRYSLELKWRSSLYTAKLFFTVPFRFTEGTKSIQINGLVWMGEAAFMKQQIEEKLAEGFTCVKLKIETIDFEKELDLLRYIRQYSEQVEIR
jgi:L-alanine-DL-glutamate epimerase-like enolase superfamily enzyme